MNTMWTGAVSSIVLFASAAAADIIIGNYPPANDLTQTADVDNLRQKAMAFTMPATTPYDVSSITLRLGNYVTPGDVAILEIRDHTGSNAAPGPNVVGSFIAPPSSSSAIADFVFMPNGAVTLQAGTSYWITLRGQDAVTSFDWKASSPGLTPTGVATFTANLFTSNGGTTWTSSTIITTFVIEGNPAVKCYPDCEGDGDLDIFDFLCFQGEFANQSAYADCENDGDWDIFDFLCFQGAFANGCD